MPNGLEDLHEYHALRYDSEYSGKFLESLGTLIQENTPHLLNRSGKERLKMRKAFLNRFRALPYQLYWLFRCRPASWPMRITTNQRRLRSAI